MAANRANAFMLSSATIMMAPAFTTPVFDMTPAANGLGMCRDVAFKVDSSMLELKNGISQSIVDARRTSVQASISAMIFEMTTANIQRAAAIANSGVTPQIKRGILTTALTGSATSVIINTDGVPGDVNSAITGVSDIPTGSTIVIQRVNGEQDYVFPTVSSGVATGTGPYTIPLGAGYAIPAGMTFPVGAHVWIVFPVIVAGAIQDDLFGVKITGTLSNYDRPVTAVFPKVRISKGFQISFTEADYGHMPFEMTPFLMSATEATGRLADIGVNAPGLVYVGA
jgi:hypothetical protein